MDDDLNRAKVFLSKEANIVSNMPREIIYFGGFDGHDYNLHVSFLLATERGLRLTGIRKTDESSEMLMRQARIMARSGALAFWDFKYDQIVMFGG